MKKGHNNFYSYAWTLWKETEHFFRKLKDFLSLIESVLKMSDRHHIDFLLGTEGSNLSGGKKTCTGPQVGRC